MIETNLCNLYTSVIYTIEIIFPCMHIQLHLVFLNSDKIYHKMLHIFFPIFICTKLSFFFIYLFSLPCYFFLYSMYLHCWRYEYENRAIKENIIQNIQLNPNVHIWYWYITFLHVFLYIFSIWSLIKFRDLGRKRILGK